MNLVEYGFRLPAAIDNRPLRFDEFERLTNQAVYVSATPADYELTQSEGVVVEQIIRPTGLLDPEIEVRPSMNQIDDLIEEIQSRVEQDERVLVTTLTKRMAEELNDYFTKMDIRTAYIHSDVETLERIKILEDLRTGIYDVLIGVNLLREGIDLPQVSLVAILDADKEGFLRNHRSLTQTAGRAARNVNGKVIMYADKITESIQMTIDETQRRRTKQMEYNLKHDIVPRPIVKQSSADDLLDLYQTDKDAKNNAEATRKGGKKAPAAIKGGPCPYFEEEHAISAVADPVTDYIVRDADSIKARMERLNAEITAAAKEMNFLEAARLRDEYLVLAEKLKELD